jgi:hypothetical protein
MKKIIPVLKGIGITGAVALIMAFTKIVLVQDNMKEELDTLGTKTGKLEEFMIRQQVLMEFYDKRFNEIEPEPVVEPKSEPIPEPEPEPAPEIDLDTVIKLLQQMKKDST